MRSTTHRRDTSWCVAVIAVGTAKMAAEGLSHTLLLLRGMRGKNVLNIKHEPAKLFHVQFRATLCVGASEGGHADRNGGKYTKLTVPQCSGALIKYSG